MKKYKIFILLLCVILITNVLSLPGMASKTYNNITMDNVIEYYYINGVDYDELLKYIDNIASSEQISPYADQPWEQYYPEDLTEDELNEVIQRIANGENVVLGDGIIVDEQNVQSRSASQGSRWKAGGYNNTHQWITANALNVLYLDGKTTVYNWITSTDRANLLTGSDWPDQHEGNVLIDQNRKHFYYWPLKSDYWGDTTTENAKTRFIYWYNQAVSNYKNGNRNSAFLDLGKAIHYLSDLYTPVHTGQKANDLIHALTVLAPVHSAFEDAANTYKNNYYAGFNGGLYNGWLNYSISYIADVVASASYNAFVTYCGSSSTYGNAYGWALDSNQRDVAGLINKFYIDTH